MDPAGKLKTIDKYVGTTLVLLLAAFERLRRLFSPGRAARGRDLSGLHNIFVVKTIAIGDVLQALPAMKAVRERFPDAHITLVTTPRVKEVVEGQPFFDDILYYDVYGIHKGVGGVIRFARELRRLHYDAWIDFEHYYRFTSILGYYTGARVIAGFDIPGQVRKYLMTIRAPYPTEAHELDSFLAIPRALGAVVEHPKPVTLPMSEADVARAREWLATAKATLPEAQRGREIVILHASTSPVSIGRRWPRDRWLKLADLIAERYGLTPVWTGGPEDEESLKRLAARTKQPSLVAAGALTLRQYSALAAMARLVVSVDTGPLHVAAATGTPTVGMFGPSNWKKWRPYGEGNAVVWAGLACSPCTTHYLGKISRKTCDDCMRGISVDAVLAAIESLPDRPPASREEVEEA